MTRRLEVILAGEHVASLERTRSGALRLTYLPHVPMAGTPISLSLPRGISHVGQPVERFVSALLPDNRDARAAIARRFALAEPGDDMAVLNVIGKDCPGAVQFCAEDEVDAVIARTGHLEPCTDSDIEARLAEMSVDEAASWVMSGEHWSLGGTQQKFALRQEGGRWFVAHGSEPTTHIVKPGVRGLALQALMEHATMAAAASLGVRTAATTYEDFRSMPALVVERFDRVRDETGRVVRLHQEDACQALGVSQKYEDAGGPAAATVADLIVNRAATRAEAETNLADFVDALVFNTVIAAPDAHARNVALLLDGDSVRLTPMFDAATSLAYEKRGPRKVAMSIGGEFAVDAITAEHWRRQAAAMGVGDDYLLGRVQYFAAAAPDALKGAFEKCGTAEARDAWTRMEAELARQCDRFEAQGAQAGPSGAPLPVYPAVRGGSVTGDTTVRPHLRDGRPVRGHRRTRGPRSA